MALGKNQNDFNGRLNEKEVLAHALNVLKKQSSPDYVSRIFPNIKDLRQRRYIDDIMALSNLFHYKQGGIAKEFRLKEFVSKELFEKEATIVIDEYINNKDTEYPPFVYVDNSTTISGNTGNVTSQSSVTESVLNAETSNNNPTTKSKIDWVKVITSILIIIAAIIGVYKACS